MDCSRHIHKWVRSSWSHTCQQTQMESHMPADASNQEIAVTRVD